MCRWLLSLVLLAPALPAQIRAFWADVFHDGIKSAAQVDQLLSETRQAGANTLFVQVRPRANSCFLNTLEPVAVEPDFGCSTSFDGLADLLRKARPLGIEVHAWLNVNTMWRATAAPPADLRHAYHQHGPNATGRANWLLLNNAGSPLTDTGYMFDPGHPEAFAYTADIIQHLVENYAVDGIHLDYVRYTGATWGYNPASVERFNLLNSRSGIPAATDPAWMEFRRQQITQLVRKIYLRAIRARPEIKVSAALVAFGAGPTSDAAWLNTDAYRSVFQNWWPWLQEGILDLGVVMNYLREHNAQHRGWFNDWIAFEKDRQGRRAIATGVAAYLNTVDNTLAQVSRVLQPSPAGAGLAGFSLYSYAVTNCDPGSSAGCTPVPRPQFYSAFQQAFPQPAPVPAMPWKAMPTHGHIYGEMKVQGGGPTALVDGVKITARPMAGGAVLETTTDAAGSFGFVELEPGEYLIGWVKGGTSGTRFPALMVTPGRVATSELLLPLDPVGRPQFTWEGVTDAASFRVGPIAPGQLVTIFGERLTALDMTASAPGLPLPPVLAGTSVLVKGQPAPLLYASSRQLNIQIPFDLSGASAEIVVSNSLANSVVVTKAAEEVAPGLFNVALHSADYSLVTAASPARPGEIILLYASGLGRVQGNALAGYAAAAAMPILARAEVTIAGHTVAPHYAGLAPGFAGLYQVNVPLPADAPAGDHSVELSIAGRTSNRIIIPVR
jgi:uncharacterized protein (TIGR03437 family)